LYQLESSRLDAFTPIRSALPELAANSGVPHTAQKLRLTVLPPSASFSKTAGVPCVSRTASREMTTVAEKALPLAIWQSRQWQFTIRSGVARHS
jgi:hypothetical protein